jgi:hypothetical protein
MRRMIYALGGIVGSVVFGVFLLGARLAIQGKSAGVGEWIGYLIMLVALSVIFVGIKKYRDRELGGVIRFGQAFMVGLRMTLVASLAYVVWWEAYQYSTDYTFVAEYFNAVLEAKKAAGVTAEELAAWTASCEAMKQHLAHPATRLMVTVLEIFPFGLIISLISAALLRNSKFLPAKT